MATAVYFCDGRTQLIFKERKGRREANRGQSIQSYQDLSSTFVDDVLIISKASLEEWMAIVGIIYVFCKAMGLEVNSQKYFLYTFGVQQEVVDTFKVFPPYNFAELVDGLNYLGFFLKLDNYKVANWRWLITKFENRISQWCNRWLSLGG